MSPSGPGLHHSTSPGSRCRGCSMGLSIADHLCTQELIDHPFEACMTLKSYTDFSLYKWNIHEYSIWILQVKTLLHSESQDPPWRWPSKPLTGFHKHVCRLWKKQFCGFFICVWYKWYHNIWMGLQPGRVVPTWQYMLEIFIFLIVHCISSGGQAVVYLALPLLTGMKVAPILSVL